MWTVSSAAAAAAAAALGGATWMLTVSVALMLQHPDQRPT